MRAFHRMLAAGLAAAVLAGAPDADAQIRVRLRTEYDRYLLFEPIVVRVRVDNEGMAPLVFGGESPNATLNLYVDLAPDRPARRTEEPVLREPFEVPAFGSNVVTVELLRLFDLPESGPIAVTACVETGGKEYASGRLLLDIVPGLSLVRMEAQLVGDGGGRREYQLRCLGRNGREHLFLRVDDPDRHVCCGVFDLGSLLRVWKPRMMLDGEGALHVLHQSAPARLTHTVYHDAERRVRSEFLSTTDRPPDLARDAEGRVTVVGAAPYQGDVMQAPRRGDRQPPPDRLPARR